MKKKIYLVLPLLLLFIGVTGCQQSEKQGEETSPSSSLAASSSKKTSQSSSSSSKTTSSATSSETSSSVASNESTQTTDSATQPDPYAQLLSGRYDLIAGTWQSQTDNLTIASDGNIPGDYFLSNPRLDGQIAIITFNTSNGESQTLYYIPAGVELAQTYFSPEGGGDVSDTSRDRLVIAAGLLFGNNNYRDHVYYRGN